MADKAKKISELGSLTRAQMNANNLVAVVDTNASETKKATFTELTSFLNDLKVSQLDSWTQAQMNANNFVLVVDNSTSTSKKATFREFNSFLNDLPHHAPIQRVNTTANTTNADYKVVLCNPFVANGNITFTLQKIHIDGKDFFVKNINTGSFSVVVSCSNNSIEASNGTFVNSVTLSSNGAYGHWIWDATSGVYRLIGGNI